MKAQDIIAIWGAPEPYKLTSKQMSIRLPIIVSAKISALCELFPRKTKTDIINDLLIIALESIEVALPKSKGEQIDETPDGMPVYETHGMLRSYYVLTERYLRELEKEAGVTEPMEFTSNIVCVGDEL